MSAFKAPEHTQVPNSLFDMMADMSEVELRVTLCAIRQTFGWHKKRDAISLTQFQKMTGLSRQGVLDGIKESEKRGTLKKAGTGKRNTTIFELVVSEPDNVIPLDQSTQLTSTSQESRPEPVNTVDTQKKEKKKKETISIEPPQKADAAVSDYARIRKALVDLGLLTTNKDRRLFEGDFDEHGFDAWLKGIEVYKAELLKQGNLPYTYLASCVATEAGKRKQAALIEASKPVVSYHSPAVMDDSQPMSDEEAMAFAAQAKAVMDEIRARKEKSA